MNGEFFKKLMIGGVILPISLGIYAVSNYNTNSLSPYLSTKSTSNNYSLIKFSNNDSLTPRVVSYEELNRAWQQIERAEQKRAAKQAARLQHHRAVDLSQQQGAYQQVGYYGGYQNQSDYFENANKKYFDPR